MSSLTWPPRAPFAELPLELCDEILTLAARSAVNYDKPWLCTLAVTSRRTLAIVRPILYETVCLTDDNIHRILSAAPAGHFALTRNLWVGIAQPDWKRDFTTLVFRNARHVVAGLLFLAYRTCACFPERLTLRTDFWNEWPLLTVKPAPPLAHLTHLRLAIGIARGPLSFMRRPGIHRAFALECVVLESREPQWDVPMLVRLLIPFFLSATRMQRVLVCASMQKTEVTDAVEAYAREHNETRLWILDAPTDGELLHRFRPEVTFDDQLWTAGRPV